ncbi:hypothetical protein CBS63078_6851 [Aspergillus niger]|uniref:Contig An04c0190, genomic contig n=5 Tax=Aspergillus TaxID=5052 RepID=A2QJD6_ASPNC|nr:uncharacterized protein An04g06680 [Aspergillus niger]XP_025457309.1 uncharacterized protein BO96DRAFT_463755 [Aspergillus niger CBS 101883]EHA20828.1 hypothetical protein ASPNIDRAFT_45318 [Aspergillus niger ATCC 1015]RDH14336.1 hypothetical protein M747DRAFT_270384 [Aspergillus niger ATCC 13496]RDK46921.1 hypothetical protein M752DRAFT_244976 [Aspergillus phoenicis ATCC 13157]KAI2815967.1 hypothetical protein CBS115989_7179 [Aspergillus niger]KAI2819981.1 hypothetical protein CBS133816_99|eukprot:XP_001402032.1 hypothetical protein ANI_1_1992184 [Aspergillus niger CBS 513.88]
MQPPNSNLRAFNLAVTTLLKTPSQFLPHLTIPTITHLPENLGPEILPSASKPPTIRALVLDKDNTLCHPKTTSFPSEILSKLHALRTSPTSPFTKDNSILIVSNRAGSHPRYDAEVRELEKELGELQIPVFRLPEGSEKKPFCGKEVLEWFRERGVVSRADEIAVVGDRLGTDVLMAVQMGSWSVWCRDGVTEGGREMNLLEKMEVWVEKYLRESRGLKAPVPKEWEGR